MPITGLACATASVKATQVAGERRAINKRVRENVFEYLDKKGVEFIKSETNFFMIEAKRPGGEIATAMAQNGVMIGRVWPIWPTKVRISVGTQEEMDKFKVAFDKVWS
jgi:histidinol-phosphate aminotransferase